jgi:hypothetical protein
MNEYYQLLFAGAGATALGTLVGSWLSFRFQKKLLQQQLDFLERIHAEQLAFQDALGEKGVKERTAITRAITNAIDDAGKRVKYQIANSAKIK